MPSKDSMPKDEVLLYQADIVRQFSTTLKRMPIIGVAGITIPGAVDCISKINQKCRGHFPSHQHPHIILDQPDFHPTHQAQNEGRWDIVEDRLVESINALAERQADFAIIPANTVHKVIAGIQKRSRIEVISILDAVADECQRQRLKKVGILGTRWTMADHLYLEPLRTRGVIEYIPSVDDRQIIQQAIFSELILTGSASAKTITLLLEVVQRMKSEGCDGIALACTELPLVLNEKNCGIPTLDTTGILANAAVKKSLHLSINIVDKCSCIP